MIPYCSFILPDSGVPGNSTFSLFLLANSEPTFMSEEESADLTLNAPSDVCNLSEEVNLSMDEKILSIFNRLQERIGYLLLKRNHIDNNLQGYKM